MVLRISTLLLLVLGITSAQSGEPETETPLVVSVVGVRVSRTHPSAERVIWPPGTSVLLEVASPLGELIQFDEVDSAVAKFVDDKGADLRAKSDDPQNKTLPGFGHAPKLSADARTCLLEINGPAVPQKGSTSLSLAGTLTMLCATKKQETIIPNVELKNGTHFAGPNQLDLEVEHVGKPDWGLEPFGFLLRAQRELDHVAEIKFFDANGAELKASRTATSTMSILGAVRAEWTYAMAQTADKATLKLYTWADAKKKRAHFDLKVELGL